MLPELRYRTPVAWVEAVLADFDSFLRDHAAAEKKAAGMAVSMLSHYPDRVELVSVMADLAVEEMSHYREMIRIIHGRGLTIGRDEKDPYVNAMRGQMRTGRDEYFLDRLLVGGVIEARGAERFALVAEALEEGALQAFYHGIARSESRHLALFVELANTYFPAGQVEARLAELLDAEAGIAAAQPIRAALH